MNEKKDVVGIDSSTLLVSMLQSKGIDVHCADCDVMSFSIDGVCFTISSKSYSGMCGDCSVIDYDHEEN